MLGAWLCSNQPDPTQHALLLTGMPEVTAEEKAVTGLLLSVVFVRLAMAYVRGGMQTRTASGATDATDATVDADTAATPEPKKTR